MTPHICIHIRKIASDHLQHRIVLQSHLQILVKTFAHLALERITEVEEFRFHSFAFCSKVRNISHNHSFEVIFR